MPSNSLNYKAWPSDNPARTSTGAKTLTYQTRTPKMAPATEPTAAAAAGRKRKKPHGPSKTLAKKPSGPKSTSGKKEKHKHTTHKEKKPRPTGPPAKKPDEPDQVAAGDGAAGGGVLLSAAMPPARQLEFLLRSFERAVKMRLSPLELDSYSGCSSPCWIQLNIIQLDMSIWGTKPEGLFCSGPLQKGALSRSRRDATRTWTMWRWHSARRGRRSSARGRLWRARSAWAALRSWLSAWLLCDP